MDKAMSIVVQNPTETRYVMKYKPKSNQFILKVTDNRKIAMKKANASRQY